MAKAKYVYVEDHDRQYENMFIDNGWLVVQELDVLNPPDLIQLVGGADVHPGLYGKVPHPTTGFVTEHDASTAFLYLWAQRNKVPIAGICRGSQFLCVMGGGQLWQDVDNHAMFGGHAIVDVASQEVIPDCSSTHHQQHLPANNAIILAIASPARCTYKSTTNDEGEPITYGGKDPAIMPDVEAFYYEHINALGFQPHPEFFDADHPCQAYYFKLIKDCFNL